MLLLQEVRLINYNVWSHLTGSDTSGDKLGGVIAKVSRVHTPLLPGHKSTPAGTVRIEPHPHLLSFIALLYSPRLEQCNKETSRIESSDSPSSSQLRQAVGVRKALDSVAVVADVPEKQPPR